jgi:hypothetical protein
MLSTAKRLHAGWGGLRILASARDFSLLQNVQMNSEAQPASYSVGIRVSFLGVKWPGYKLTAHLPQVPRLRITEAVYMLPVYAFIEWTGTILPF